ncbi:type II toxin-antitoxin system RelE/ParE family toxin [Verminephrobacter eiseniae]|uniref:RelE-like cytotoxic translational repressor of toxin-antitoxin stability system n=1 Tax=Verminephrobacter eiseniae (strain EF01-2) TaxID=391735 RepID=A1WQC4_VEREI|nr:type II toxin-antitoxin system RelE/ParE family toxin [Verminephrobacter eiseniae]ABM59831.1 RelE-like cytotoxic translational repressor of toxin-antitoxin stability system [Verminephrobacter eiseniae EF01-2]MCW5285343.1 addiction module toxin RelE [Verminephrobacter eiseniae]MCW5303050.1 addiction module toxin RelE [Verminephrobacter eiseniae]MCW8181411.1 addiction module toxin RelE [Verminephrobacter eiseniae]MCW8190487.1 addiction module toxin RelE [Verminephrobacter eiseniae]
METKPITIVEIPAFLTAAGAIWTDEERAELIDYVARNPESGNVIPGTGGVRKLRWGRAGIGKRGGARVIYFYYRTDAPIYMLSAYAKAANVDLTPDQKKQVTKLTAILKEHHAVKGD